MKYTYYKRIIGDKVTYSDKSGSPILPVVLEVGDEVTYVTQEGTYKLISCPEEIKGSCYKCDVSANNGTGLECFNSHIIRCDNIRVKLIHSELTIEVSKIKSVLCNEDVCPYFIENCDKYVGQYSSSCIFKKIIELIGT